MTDLAALNARLDRLEADHRAAFTLIDHKLNVLLRGIHAVITLRQDDMSKIHDDIATALASNATKIQTLVGLKDESDSAFSDILQTVKDQGTLLDQALAADQAASGASSTDQSGTDGTASGDDAAAGAADQAPTSGTTDDATAGSSVAGTGA